MRRANTVQDEKHYRQWQNSEKRRRLHLHQRRRLCRMLGWHVDCIATVCEMLQTLRARRAK